MDDETLEEQWENAEEVELDDLDGEDELDFITDVLND